MIGVTLIHDSPIYLLLPTVTTDSYGDAVESWANPERLRLPGASLESPASEEDETPTLDVLHNERVLMVRGVIPIDTRYRVEAEGSQWRIDGKPLVRRGALSAFTRAKLRRAEAVSPRGA